jgi:hypothetical protein
MRAKADRGPIKAVNLGLLTVTKRSTKTLIMFDMTWYTRLHGKI